MEKVFAMDAGEKFDVARLGSPSESAGSDRDRDRGPPPRYGGDRDFNRKNIVASQHYFFIFDVVSPRIGNDKNNALQNTVKEATHIRTCL